MVAIKAAIRRGQIGRYERREHQAGRSPVRNRAMLGAHGLLPQDVRDPR